ncbi:MAG: S-formylglutathione hydrolase [Pseudomonadales bacterium]|jgi:S-formylglutathione hydrolase|tara:strand:- start:367 stop:1206 length:840 start_codon:yes stop_codon:yes gene_type:complete
MESIACNKMFGGEQRRYKHKSETLSCDMHFSIYLPPQVSEGRVPVLYWLSGLTGTDENFVIKAGAQRVASQLGLAIVMGDTSPRGEDVPDDPEQAYDFGLGAGFYLNATQAPWNKHYKMYDYVTQELPALINDTFPVDPSRQSIFGHSMGGHGALSIALKNPDQYKSVSAFAPIVSPMNCPWGCKAFKSYLGEDVSTWQEYDSAALIAKATTHLPMLVDQGTADEFLDNQLKPELLLEAAEKAGYPLQFIEREGYDHSYFFIASFIQEHLRFHEKILSA